MLRHLPQLLALAILLALMPRLVNGQAIVTVDGTARLAPITQAAARIYHDLVKSTVKVSNNFSRTANGLKRFCRGEVDVSGAVRPMLQEELQLCKLAGIEFYEVPIAYDVLMIIVNIKNHWANSIKMDDLKRLWLSSVQNPVNRWNQVQPQWPSNLINLYGNPLDNEILEFFSAAINNKAKVLRNDVNTRRRSAEVVDGVASDPLAIGYCPFAECAKKAAELKILPVDFGQGPVTPSAQTVQNNRYPRLSRPMFLYINNKSTERVAVHQFVALYLLRANQIVSKAGYVPLSAKTYMIAVNLMKNKKVGSVYAGEAQSETNLDKFIATNGSLR